MITVLGLLAYSITFHNPFQFDDKWAILGNPLIKDIDNFISSTKGYDYNPRRFIGYLSFALNYHMGELNVLGYHVVNLVIHIANAVLVYFLLILTFKTPSIPQSTDSSSPPVPVLIALFSALLFVSHPLQTQAVTYVVQRFTSLATLFYLLSLVMYIKGRLVRRKQGETEGTLFSPPSVLCYLVSFISAVFAMKTKEIAFTLPVMVVLYEFTFFKSSFKKKLLFLLPIIVTLIIVPLSILQSDKPLGEILSDVSEKTKVQTRMSRWDYLVTEMRVIVTYIRLILVPVNQNLDYDYPIYHSLFTPFVFLSFLFLLSIFGIGIYLLYRSYSRRLKPSPFDPYYRIIGFGIVWFFITLSVESSIIPIVDVIFEHRVYLPSVGVFAGITTGLFFLANKMKMERIVVPVLILATLILSGVTYARNTVWKDEISLWEDVVKKSPNKARPHNNLGEAYDRRGRLDDAFKEFQAAIRLKPDFAEAHYNLGTAYATQDRLDEALREFQVAIRLKPDYIEAHNNLGNVYVAQGRLGEALREYQTALSLNPDDVEAHNNLGVAYYAQGHVDKALREYQTALNLNPDHAEAHYNLGLVYYTQGHMDDALRELKTALRLNPDHAKAHNNLGVVYYAQGHVDDALKEFQAALKLKPDFAQARNNLESLQKMVRSK